MNSHSQAGQDLFVDAVLRQKRHGRFIEIGCAHPIEINNTYALETERDWRGLMVDVSPEAIRLCGELRKSYATVADACKCDWPYMIVTHLPQLAPGQTPIDYASVDIDEWTHDALKNLMRSVRPAVLTVEHDHYQRGDRLRLPNRELLLGMGYALVAADVHSNGCSFEDWFCDPKQIDPLHYELFHSTGLDWRDVLREGGAL